MDKRSEFNSMVYGFPAVNRHLAAIIATSKVKESEKELDHGVQEDRWYLCHPLLMYVGPCLKSTHCHSK